MTAGSHPASVSGAMTDKLPKPDRNSTPDRWESGRFSQFDGMDQAIQALGYLIAGIVVYGGLGWLGDHYLGTRFLLPLGIMLGAAGGIYLIIRRFGVTPEDEGPKK